MGRVDVGRVLTAIGAVSEATTTDELLDAALACAVVVAGADSGVITLTGPAVPLVRWWPDDFLA
ncbi:MAG: hypothetical protein JWL73_2020, partial [Actinomycetia bacterium]|nr:hypothetical protein [Actinomycetes bacterium]